jgi:hypothetical protein
MPNFQPSFLAFQHQTVSRAAPEPPRSLPVVPLIADKRYYGEAPGSVRWGYGGLWGTLLPPPKAATNLNSAHK